MQIWHLECCYCLTSILGRRPWPDYPRHSLWMSLNHFLLDAHQPHTMSASWRHFIWMLCYYTKCSIYPAVVFSWWRLQEWFQHIWLTNTFVKNTHTYTTSPAWIMHLSIQHTLPLTEKSNQHLADFHKCLPDQCSTTYHLLPTVLRVTRIQTAYQNTQMMRKISKQYL